jgi:hypothetical protein
MADFSQKDRLFEVKASFSENFLEYHLKRDRQEIQAFIPYTELSNDLQGGTERYGWLLPLAAFHLCASVFTLDNAGRFHSPGFALLFAVGAVVYLWIFFRTRYKLLWLKGEKHSVTVLNNPAGRDFLEQVRRRRRDYLKATYGKINWENNVETELGRFRWLNVQGALSDAEFENLRATLLNK